MKTQIALAGLLAALIGCASRPASVPPPTAEGANRLVELKKKQMALVSRGIVCGVGIGQSADQQMALEMAELNARSDLGRSIETKAASVQKSFREQTGSDLVAHGEAINQSIASNLLRGTILSDVEVETVSGSYQVYGLMVQDPALFAKAMEAELGAQKADLARFRASQAYADMQKEVERYETWKQEQNPAH